MERPKLIADMMDKCQSLGLALLAGCMLGDIRSPGLAAQSETPTTLSSSGDRSDAARLGLITRTTALLGAKVRDHDDSALGNMDDIIVCLPAGQAVAAFVCCSDDQVIPVPARSFWTATGNKIMVNADKRKLKGAPSTAKSDLNRSLEVSRLKPAFDHFDQDLPEVLATGVGGLSSAARLIHQKLLSQSGQPLGQVEDLMLDLPVGRLVYLVIQPVGGADAQSARYLVPPQALRSGTNGQALVLQADQAHFLAGPRFQEEYWTDTSRPELRAAVLQHYRPQAASGQPDTTREPVRPRLESAASTCQVTSARSDQETTQAIVTEIVRNDSAFPTRELKIAASNGRVTLSGRVKNGKQTQQLVAAAARVVGAQNVVNQLQTR